MWGGVWKKEEEAVPVFQSEEVVPYVPAFAREIEQQSEDASLEHFAERQCTASWSATSFLPVCPQKSSRRDAGERTDHTGDAWTDSHTAG